MDGTMMTKICAMQRFTKDYPPPEREGLKGCRETAAIRIGQAVYEQLVGFLKKTNPGLRDHNETPHPTGSTVLLPFATLIMTVNIENGMKVFGISPRKPNNMVMYREGNKGRRFAKVKQIYRFEIGAGGVEEAVLVEPIIDMYPKAIMGPSRNFRYYLHIMGCVVGEIKKDVTLFLNLKDVKAVAAYRLLPPQTFGLPRGGVILKPIDL